MEQSYIDLTVNPFWRSFMNPSASSSTDLGIAVLRVSLGVMWVAHTLLRLRRAAAIKRSTLLAPRFGAA
jgi:hypothetical protein